MTTPSFYAIIPANVRYCKDIESGAKLLYGELTALAQKEGYCWASNKYLASLYDVDAKTIQRWIASLRNQKFIEVEVETGGFQTTRKIWICPGIKKISTEGQNCQGGQKKIVTPDDKNVLHINTSINTEEKKEPPPSPTSLPKKLKTPVTKEDWRRFFSNWKKEEFEFAWEEYEKMPPGHVKSIKHWLPKVRDRYNTIVEKKTVSDGIVYKRKMLAESWDGKKFMGYRVTACKEQVEFTEGSYYKSVRYDAPQEDWEEKTGWKEKD